jgi:hypothetical protein
MHRLTGSAVGVAVVIGGSAALFAPWAWASGNAAWMLSWFVALALVHLAGGYAVGRWLAVVALPVATALVLAAVYGNYGEPPSWVFYVLLGFLDVPAVGIGVALRKRRGSRLRRLAQSDADQGAGIAASSSTSAS